MCSMLYLYKYTCENTVLFCTAPIMLGGGGGRGLSDFFGEEW